METATPRTSSANETNDNRITRREARARLRSLQGGKLPQQANPQELVGIMDVLYEDELTGIAVDALKRAEMTQQDCDSNIMIAGLIAHMMKKKLRHGQFTPWFRELAEQAGRKPRTLSRWKRIYDKLPEDLWAVAWAAGPKKADLVLRLPKDRWRPMLKGAFLVPDEEGSKQRCIETATEEEVKKVVDKIRVDLGLKRPKSAVKKTSDISEKDADQQSNSTPDSIAEESASLEWALERESLDLKVGVLEELLTERDYQIGRLQQELSDLRETARERLFKARRIIHGLKTRVATLERRLSAADGNSDHSKPHEAQDSTSTSLVTTALAS